MSSKHTLRVVDELLQDICKKSTLFAGKVMLLGGDFRQCLPVVVKRNKTTTLEETIKFSSYWRAFRKLRLRTNIRAIHDQEFSDWILDIGNGAVGNGKVTFMQENVVSREDIDFRRRSKNVKYDQQMHFVTE